MCSDLNVRTASGSGALAALSHCQRRQSAACMLPACVNQVEAPQLLLQYTQMQPALIKVYCGSVLAALQVKLWDLQTRTCAQVGAGLMGRGAIHVLGVAACRRAGRLATARP